jgi:hypothetical protein
MSYIYNLNLLPDLIEFVASLFKHVVTATGRMTNENEISIRVKM